MSETTKKSRGASGRRSPAGHSVRAASILSGVPRGRICRAIELDEVEVIRFGGLVLLPDRAVERLKQMYFGTEAAE